VAPELFRLTVLRRLDLSYNRLALPASGKCPHGAFPGVVDLSGNRWDTDLDSALFCLLGSQVTLSRCNASTASEIFMQNMNITGSLYYATLAGSAVSRLHLDGNAIAAQPTQADVSSFSLQHVLDELSVAGNPLSAAFSLDGILCPASTPRARTPATLSSPAAVLFSVRGVRPQPTCSRAKEDPVATSVFRSCDNAPESGDGSAGKPGLNYTMCVRAGNRVSFTDTQL
jgi:hypothetical protein